MPMSPRLLRPKAASGFDPRTISGLAVWLDASVSSSVTLNSGNVSQWNDLSGNGRNATQATAGNQPSYSTSALNGRNVVVAQDSSRSMVVAAFPAGLPNTVFVVGNIGGGGQGIFQRGSLNQLHSLFRNSGGATPFTARRGGTLDATFSPNTAYNVFTCVFSETLSRLFVGSTQGTDNTATVSNVTSNQALTLFNLGGGVFGLVGGIAELLYYNGQLSSEAQGAVRSYLSKKWSVPL